MDYRWLLSDAAAKWLAAVADCNEPTLKLAARLRKDLTAEQVHLVLEQAALQRQAGEKFTLAAQMFFTPKGLEQSTDEWVAAYKGERFASAATPARSDNDEGWLADLCCGIGGDLLAIGCRGTAIGVERDPVAAMFAEANVTAWQAAGRSVNQVEMKCGDVAEIDARQFSAWHLDPDRRPAGRRTTKVVAHEPGPEVIERLLAESPNGAIKLAPAAVLPDDWPRRAELEWISRSGECRQLVAWFGDLAKKPGQRSATVLSGRVMAGSPDPALPPTAGLPQPKGGRPSVASMSRSGDRDITRAPAPRTVSGEPDMTIPLASRVGRFVFEPDAAVLAAKLTGALAAKHGLATVTPGIAYLTGETLINDVALACFEVLDLLPLRAKLLKDWLDARGIGRLEIKKRGVDLDPDQLRRQLRLAR